MYTVSMDQSFKQLKGGIKSIMKVPEVFQRPRSEKDSNHTFLSQNTRLPVGCVSILVHVQDFLVPFLSSSLFLMLPVHQVSKKAAFCSQLTEQSTCIYEHLGISWENSTSK